MLTCGSRSSSRTPTSTRDTAKLTIAAGALTLAATGALLLLGAAENSSAGAQCFGKPATITRGDGNNEIQGTAGSDVIVAGGGDDSIEAHSGKDRVCAGNGNDLVFTGPADDKVAGGNGRDELHGVGGKDLLKGEKGDDSGTVAHALVVTIDAGLYGEADADDLNGGPGSDYCNGGAGPDDATSCEVFER